MTDAEMTGTLWIENGLIRNRSSFFGNWDLPVSSLRLVGEATNEDGPGLDDWMLILVTQDGEWFTASFYATIGNEFMDRLGELLGAQLSSGLAQSATFNSRVLWPTQLEGRAIFRYDSAPPRNLLERIWWRLFGPMRIMQRPTVEVAAHLSPLGGAPKANSVRDGPHP